MTLEWSFQKYLLHLISLGEAGAGNTAGLLPGAEMPRWDTG